MVSRCNWLLLNFPLENATAFSCQMDSKLQAMKITRQYFPVVLFITQYKVVLPFESVGEILMYYHSNES